MRVRLTRKLAECIDGIDLTGYAVGDVLEIPERDALCLVAEGWASPIRFGRRQTDRRVAATLRHRHSATADDHTQAVETIGEPAAMALLPVHAPDGNGSEQILIDAERLAGRALDHERRLGLLVKLLETNAAERVLAPTGLGAAAVPYAVTVGSADLLAIVRELCVEAREHRQLAQTILTRLVGEPPPAGSPPPEPARDETSDV